MRYFIDRGIPPSKLDESMSWAEFHDIRNDVLDTQWKDR